MHPPIQSTNSVSMQFVRWGLALSRTFSWDVWAVSLPPVAVEWGSKNGTGTEQELHWHQEHHETQPQPALHEISSDYDNSPKSGCSRSLLYPGGLSGWGDYTATVWELEEEGGPPALFLSHSNSSYSEAIVLSLSVHVWVSERACARAIKGEASESLYL